MHSAGYFSFTPHLHPTFHSLYCYKLSFIKESDLYSLHSQRALVASLGLLPTSALITSNLLPLAKCSLLTPNNKIWASLIFTKCSLSSWRSSLVKSYNFSFVYFISLQSRSRTSLRFFWDQILDISLETMGGGRIWSWGWQVFPYGTSASVKVKYVYLQ